MSYTSTEYAEMAARANAEGKLLEVIDGELVLIDPPPPPEPTLTEAKAAKLQEINAACDDILNALVYDYPASEIQTFAQQATEATEYRKSSGDMAGYLPPLLSTLAHARGVPLPELANRVLAKHETFSQVAGLVIGQRQALEDQLKLAETVDDVLSINVVIHIPGGN